jgi:hypothetical protein
MTFFKRKTLSSWSFDITLSSKEMMFWIGCTQTTKAVGFLSTDYPFMVGLKVWK